MDPVTIGLLSGLTGGVGGEAAKALWQAAGRRWFVRWAKNHGAEVRQRAQSNTVEFLSLLAVRLDRLEQRLLATGGPSGQAAVALSDPDFAGTLHAAFRAAARTGSAAKHDVLAAAVAERLIAPAESREAVASNLAVEVLPRLTLQQLNVLGILALIWTIRPPGIARAAGARDVAGEPEVDEVDDAQLMTYGAWLKTAFGIFPTTIEISEPELMHIASTSCATAGERTRRHLHMILEPVRLRWDASKAERQANAQVLSFLAREPEGTRLLSWWRLGLQRLTPTPAGILIGTAVYSHLTGLHCAVNWPGLGARDAIVDEGVKRDPQLIDWIADELESRDMRLRRSQGELP